jgi:hypothetical protein
MYSLNANKVGTPTDNLRTYSDINRTNYDGVEFSAQARLSKASFLGGITTERRRSTSCDERDNPNGYRFCDAVPPFRTQVKLSAIYQAPWDVQISGAYFGTPGPSVSATYTVTAAIAGRSIIGSTAGATTMNVNLIQPNTVFLDYLHRFDMRLAKNFRFGSTRIQGFMDIFNIMNFGTVTRVNETYGAVPATNAWMTPLALQEARYFRFGTQISF